jgi:hypothetical protein
MLVTIYFAGLVSTGIRVLMNMSYLIYIIYLQGAHEISKAPYELTAGYYLNIICPVIYIILTIGSAVMHRES